MKISSVFVEKFRNLTNLHVNLDETINYLVGANNIGKSNFIELLSFVANPYGVNIVETASYNRPVKLTLTLRPEHNEIELYSELIDSDGLISISIERDFNASELKFTGGTQQISVEQLLRKINFTKYNTFTAKEESQVTQYPGEFPSSLSLYISEVARRDPKKSSIILKFFTEYLLKKEAFKKLKIKAQAFEDLNSFSFIDKNSRPTNETLDGLQFIAAALFDIVINIFNLSKNRADDLSENIVLDRDGKKLYQLILAVDDPEVHLHPYLQRSLVGSYKKIFANQDLEFNALLKRCFDLDGICGQLFIVTHSTDALMDDHRNIVRFYRTPSGDPCAVSGSELKLQRDVEKHLIMHFPEIKEAFYSKCALIVEGESEYGCMGLFAETLGKPLDDYGICLVNARGEGTIPKLMKLFNYFKIPSVVIFDNDVRRSKQEHENIFFTSGICFEMDVVEALFNKKRFDLLHDIISETDPNAFQHRLDLFYVKKPLAKIKYNTTNYKAKKLDELSPKNKREFISLHYAWFYRKKGILLGRIIGHSCDRDLIPPVYKRAIYKSIELSLR